MARCYGYCSISNCLKSETHVLTGILLATHQAQASSFNASCIMLSWPISLMTKADSRSDSPGHVYSYSTYSTVTVTLSLQQPLAHDTPHSHFPILSQWILIIGYNRFASQSRLSRFILAPTQCSGPLPYLNYQRHLPVTTRRQ